MKILKDERFRPLAPVAGREASVHWLDDCERTGDERSVIVHVVALARNQARMKKPYSLHDPTYPYLGPNSKSYN